MFQRHSFLVMALFTALLVGAGTTLSQTGSSESASKLLTEGSEAYQKGDLQGARETLKKVDPVQLDRPQRVQLSKMLKDIDAQLSAAAAASAAAAETTAAAEKAAAEKAASDKAAADAAAVVAEQKAKASTAAKAAATAAAVKAGADAQAKAEADKAAEAKAAAEAQAKADADAKAAADAAAATAAAEKAAADKAAADAAAQTASVEAAKTAAKTGAVGAAVAARKTADDKAAADAAAAAKLAADEKAAADAKTAAEAAEAAKVAAAEKAAADEKLAAEQKAAADQAAAAAEAAGNRSKAADAAKLAAIAAATQAKTAADTKAAEAAAADAKAAEAKAAAEQAALVADKQKADEAKAAADKAAADAVAAQAAAEKAAADKAVADAEAAKKAAEAEKAEKEQKSLMQLAVSLRSQEQVANGKRLQANNQLPQALAAYRDALALDPSNKEVQALIAGVEAKQATVSAPTSLIGEDTTANVVRADAAVLDINQQLDMADQLRKKQMYVAARSSISQANSVLSQNQKSIPGDRAASLRTRIDALDALIASEESSAKTNEALIAKENDKIAQEQKKRDIEAQKDQEVQNLLRRVQELRKEQKYDEALRLVNQILFIKENDPAALFIKEMIEEARIITIYHKHTQTRSKYIAEHSALNIEASTPYTALLTYPPDWPQLTERRFRNKNKDAGDSIANIRVREKLDEPLETVDFQAFRLSTVIDYLRRITALNFDVNWPALEEVGVAKDTPVTLQLNNVPAREVLRLVLAQISPPGDNLNPVSFAVINGIVRISTQRVLNKDLDTKMYDIRDLLHEVSNPQASSLPSFSLSTALSSSGTSVSSQGSSAFTSGTSSGGSSSIFGTSTSTTGTTGPTEPLLNRIQDLIRQTVGNPEDWDIAGGTVSSMREINGNLIIKTTPQYQREIARLLASLRETRAHQITVEARFLLVDQNFLEEVGVDVDIQFNPNSTSWSPIKVAQDSWSLAQRGSTGLPGSFGSQATQPPPIPNFVPGTGFTPSGRSFDFGVSYLDDVQVNLLIRATQANRRSISLTAPRVTFMNGQSAYVAVAKQISFISALEPVPDAAGFNPQLSVISSGVLLAVRGTITDDRRYVTLSLNPSLSTVTQPIRTIPQIASVAQTTATTTTTTTATSTSGNTIISAYIEAPEVDVTQIETTVTVPDKGTLLLGGQRLVGENEVEAGVPILSKIPIINRLFTNRSTIKDERTLLILVKPTIIITDEEEEELYPGLLERYDRGRGTGSGSGPRSASVGIN